MQTNTTSSCDCYELPFEKCINRHHFSEKKKTQAQVENEKQCKAIRQHSADKKANKTDDKAIKLLSEISSFTTAPRMKLFVVIVSLPLSFASTSKLKQKARPCFRSCWEFWATDDKRQKEKFGYFSLKQGFASPGVI